MIRIHGRVVSIWGAVECASRRAGDCGDALLGAEVRRCVAVRSAQQASPEYCSPPTKCRTSLAGCSYVGLKAERILNVAVVLSDSQFAVRTHRMLAWLGLPAVALSLSSVAACVAVDRRSCQLRGGGWLWSTAPTPRIRGGWLLRFTGAVGHGRKRPDRWSRP